MEKYDLIPLYNAKTKNYYKVIKLDKSLSFYEKERLMSCGFIEENSIKVIRKSLFGGTLQVQLSDSQIIIRRDDAKKIWIKIL